MHIRIVKKELKTTGMICESCEKVISKHLSKLPGISQVTVSYADSKTTVEYDPEKISLSEIKEKIAERGYSCIEEQIEKCRDECEDTCNAEKHSHTQTSEKSFSPTNLTDLIPFVIIGLGIFVLLFFVLSSTLRKAKE